jgi:hypothetical protein
MGEIVEDEQIEPNSSDGAPWNFAEKIAWNSHALGQSLCSACKGLCKTATDFARTDVNSAIWMRLFRKANVADALKTEVGHQPLDRAGATAKPSRNLRHSFFLSQRLTSWRMDAARSSAPLLLQMGMRETMDHIKTPGYHQRCR